MQNICLRNERTGTNLVLKSDKMFSYFLRVIAGIDAFLVNVYFINDPHSPTTIKEWKPAISEVKQQLGLASPAPFSGGVFLDAVP
jgi:hypothetical protein